MSFVGTALWESLEKRSGLAFLIGGVIFIADTAVVSIHLVNGTEPGAFGQAFVGASWTAAFIGLLGFYSMLSTRSYWLSRVGAVFAVIGGITMASMAVTSLGYFTGLLAGSLSDLIMFFLPGVFLGIVLGFGSFGIACLRTDIYTRRIGLLLLILPLTFLFNLGTGVADIGGKPKILTVVVVLALTMLSIGYLLRSGTAVVAREGPETPSDATTE